MSIEVNISFKSDCVYVQITGEDSYQASLEMFEKIAEACDDFDCLNVLVSSNLTPLRTMEAYNHFEILKKVGITYKHRIAWSEKNPLAKETDHFIETVLKNRGFYQFRMFSDDVEAQKWLFGKSES